MSYDEESATVNRIIEHKHFSPRKAHECSILYKEFSCSYETDNITYYPIRLVEEPELLRQYGAQANADTGINFVGRLGTYRYLYMDGTIREILDTVRTFEMGTLPSFVKTTV